MANDRYLSNNTGQEVDKAVNAVLGKTEGPNAAPVNEDVAKADSLAIKTGSGVGTITVYDLLLSVLEGVLPVRINEGDDSIEFSLGLDILAGTGISVVKKTIGGSNPRITYEIKTSPIVITSDSLTAGTGIDITTDAEDNQIFSIKDDVLTIDKLKAGTGVNTTQELNGDLTLSLASDYIINKLSAGTNVDITETNGVIEISASAPAGPAGPAGDDGVSVSGARIQSDELILELSDASELNVGNVKGPAGTAGVSVTNATINPSDELVLTFSDASTVNLGSVKGPTGSTGPAGRSVSGAAIVGGQLQISYSDATSQNLGNIVGPAGPAGAAAKEITTVEVQGDNLVITYDDASSDVVNNAFASKLSVTDVDKVVGSRFGQIRKTVGIDLTGSAAWQTIVWDNTEYLDNGVQHPAANEERLTISGIDPRVVKLIVHMGAVSPSADLGFAIRILKNGNVMGYLGHCQLLGSGTYENSAYLEAIDYAPSDGDYYEVQYRSTGSIAASNLLYETSYFQLEAIGGVNVVGGAPVDL